MAAHFLLLHLHVPTQNLFSKELAATQVSTHLEWGSQVSPSKGPVRSGALKIADARAMG
jgi:hypothetical protein